MSDDVQPKQKSVGKRVLVGLGLFALMFGALVLGSILNQQGL